MLSVTITIHKSLVNFSEETTNICDHQIEINQDRKYFNDILSRNKS